MHDGLRIRNWDKWQSYRRDRGQPPWIKIQRALIRDPEWVALTDAQRGQLVVIWVLAADRDGVIPASPALIRKLCYMDSEPDLELFMDHGFIERDANVTPRRRQDDAPEERREEAEERRGESAQARPPAKKRASKRCPQEFQVTEDLMAWAAENVPDADLNAETAAFRDHEFATARSDWPAVWRNWIRRSKTFGRSGQSGPSDTDPYYSQLRRQTCS